MKIKELSLLIICFIFFSKAKATHCDPIFTIDITADIVSANTNGTTFMTVNFDCTGETSCNTFFQVEMLTGETLDM